MGRDRLGGLSYQRDFGSRFQRSLKRAPQRPASGEWDQTRQLARLQIVIQRIDGAPTPRP